jgi:two-component system, NtrC family, response regulator AtoC
MDLSGYRPQGPPAQTTERSVLFVASLESRACLADYLEHKGFSVIRESRIPAAIVRYEREQPGCLVLDLLACGDSPTQWITQFGALGATTVALVTPAVPTSAADALRHGAAYVLPEPIDLAHFEAVLEQADEQTKRRRQAAFLRTRQAWWPVLDLMAASAGFMEVVQRARVLAASQDTTVLLTGEDGTGKRLMARWIHEISPRRPGVFAEVSCHQHTPHLGSILFGHEPGIDSQADRRRYGAFELASGGTVFLNGLEGLTADLQSQVRRVLEAKTTTRVGGREIAVDVRCVVATSNDLDDAVRTGRLSQGLYNHLCVAPLKLPSFRDLPMDDRRRLLTAVVDRLTHLQCAHQVAIGDAALEALLDYSWPGNLREVRNVLERAILIAAGAGPIGLRHLPAEVRGDRSLDNEIPPVSLAALEKQHILRTLKRRHGNRSAAARDLGIARATLITKIAKYQVDR